MNGDREPGLPLVPAEITERTEQTQESVIIEQLISGKHDDDAIFAAVESKDGRTQERVSKLYRSADVIQKFTDELSARVPLADERRDITEALALMLKLHINQPDRADDSGPYITHPLRVALGVLETYKGDYLADTVIAALLHDSVEDQSKLLRLLQMEEEFADERSLDEFFAISGIEYKFGPDVAELVRILSNPKDVMESDFSKDAYLNFVKNIVTNRENHGPEAFVIKWQDARENMLHVGDLWRRAKYLREVAITTQAARRQELLKEASRVEELYTKLRDKYELVLREVFLPAFENMGEGHIMYNLKSGAINDIKTALETEYDLDEES